MLIFLFLLTQYNFNPLDYSEASALIVNDYKIMEYDRDYRVTQTHEVVIHIFNKRGRELYGDLFEKYNKNEHRLELVAARTILPDGKILIPETKAISDLGTVEGFLSPTYKDYRTRTVSYSGVVPGATIEYKSRKTSKKSPSSKYVSGIILFQRNDPILHKKFVLKIPDDKGFEYKIFGPVKTSEQREGDFIIYEWSVDSMPRFKNEPNIIPKAEFCPRVMFTNFKDWCKVSADLSERFKKAIIISKEIKEMSDSFIGKRDEIIKEIYEFITKNWRDVPLGLDDVDYTPTRTDEVYKNRYGNQLDKCALLVAFLKAKRIDALPGFVSFSSPEKLLPMPDYFSSVVVVVPKNDFYIILDPRFPERSESGFDIQGILKEFNNNFPLQTDVVGRTIFIPMEKTPIFIKAPDYGEQPVANLELNLQIQIDGSITGEIISLLNGYSAINARAALRHKKERELRISLENSLNRIKTGTIINSYQIEGLDEPCAEVKIDVQFTAPDYLTRQEKSLKFNILEPIFSYFNLSSYFDVQRREYPFTVTNARKISFIMTINYPENLKIIYKPDDVIIDNELARASNLYGLSDHRITIKKSLNLKRQITQVVNLCP